MNMYQTAGFITLIAVVVIIFRRVQAAKEQTPTVTKSKRRHQFVHRLGAYHAVSVVAQKDACQEAKHLKGKRYLLEEAPALPLVGCGADTCNCIYAHYKDRRKGDRRDTLSSGRLIDPNAKDRRSGKDRRQSFESFME